MTMVEHTRGRSRNDGDPKIEQKHVKNQGNHEKWFACSAIKRYLSFRKKHFTGKWMKQFFVLLLGPVCLVVAACSPPSTTQIAQGPWLARAGDSTMTVVWTTKEPVKGSVDFGPGQRLDQQVVDSHSTVRHVIPLSGLMPGTQYGYRLIAGRDSSTVSQFTTFPVAGAPLTFAIYGDTRSDHAAHISVLRRMELYRPMFVVNTGDLVASNTKENWNAFFRDLCDSSGIGRSSAYYATPGNHENGPMYYQEEVLPTADSARLAYFYSFTAGEVHCIALNTEIDFDPGSEQYSWLKADLASPACRNAAFRIAYWHRPPYSTSNHGSDLHVRTVLCPLMEENNVNFVFAGHDHCYERTNPINGTTYIVTGGGGAPLYDFRADSAWVAYKEAVHHFCLLTASGDSLRMLMIRASDGAVGDSAIAIRRTSR